MTNDGKLTERLRAVESAKPEWHGGPVTCWHRNPDGPEAADTITALVEALKRIRDFEPSESDGTEPHTQIAVHARAIARAALSLTSSEGGEA